MKFRILTALALFAWATCAHATIINFSGSLSSTSFSESGANGPSSITVTITFQSDSNLGASVPLNITPQGQGPQYATPGVDYTAPSTVNATLTGQTASLRNYQASFVVAAINDSIIENAELVNLLVFPASGGGSAQYFAQISLTDTTARPTVTISTNGTDPFQSSDAFEEIITTTQFILTRSGRTDLRTVVTLVLSGAAVNGVDYQAVGTQVVFNTGETVKKITIFPIDDRIAEDNERLDIRIAPGSSYTALPSGGADGGSATLFTIIIDNDQDLVPTPTPVVTPTPNPEVTMQTQPVRVVGMYPAQKTLFSGDGFGLAIAHGPVISIHNADTFWKSSDIVNIRWVPEGYTNENGELTYLEQADVLDMGWSRDRGLMVTTLGSHGALWDVFGRTLLKTYDHGETVTKVLYNDANSTDILQAKVALGGTQVSVWSAWLGEQLVQILPAGTLTTMEFSRDGSLLFIASRTSGASIGQLWDLNTIQVLHTFSLPASSVINDASFTADKQFLILGQRDNRISVINLSTYVTDYRIVANEPVTFVEVDPSNTVFAANYNGDIRFWNLINFQPTPDAVTGVPLPRDASFSADRTRITGVNGNKALVIDLNEDKVLLDLGPYPLDRFTQVGPGGAILFTNPNKEPELWSYHTGLRVAQLPIWDNTDTSPAQRLQDFSANKQGSNLALLTKDDVTTDMIQIYDLQTGNLVTTAGFADIGANCIELADSELRTYLGGRKDLLFIRAFDSELSGSQLVTTFSLEVEDFDSVYSGNIRDIALSEDEETLASVSDLAKLQMHHTSDGSLDAVYEHDLFTTELDQVILSEDKKLAIAVNSSGVYTWDTDRDTLLSIYHGGRVRSTISPDNDWMTATNFLNNNTVLFRPGSEIGFVTEYLGVVGNTDPVRDYEFVPGSQRFFTLGGKVGEYDTVWLWDIAFDKTATQRTWDLYE